MALLSPATTSLHAKLFHAMWKIPSRCLRTSKVYFSCIKTTQSRKYGKIGYFKQCRSMMFSGKLAKEICRLKGRK